MRRINAWRKSIAWRRSNARGEVMLRRSNANAVPPPSLD